MPQPYTYRLRTVDVRVSEDFPRDGEILGDPQVVGEFLLRRIRNIDGDQEHFIMLAIDGRHRLIGIKNTASGTATQCPVDPKRIFRLGLELGASGLILAHNHPSGQLEPSADDIALTRRLVKAGNMLGMTIYDHMITGRDQWLSLRQSRPGLFTAGTTD